MKFHVVSSINPETDPTQFYGYVGIFAMNPEVIKEYEGYPVITKKGWLWGVVLKERHCIAFYAYSLNTNNNTATLENIYVRKDLRKQGIFNLMYNDFIKHIPNGIVKIKLLSTLIGKPIYKSKGFVITRGFKKWFHMEKTIKSDTL